MRNALSVVVVFAGLSAFAQKDVNLNLVHNYNGSPFVYGQVYTTPSGDAVSFDRVQYYLSGFELTHDGGQVLDMPDTYIIGSGNVNSYSLGNENVTTVEGLSFDLGVDATANGTGSSNWPVGHPLSPQTPSMDWSWPSGYFFFIIDGLVDDTGDGIPNQAFSMRAVGNNFLRAVDPFTSLNMSGPSIDFTIDVNIGDWIANTNLATVGIIHATGGPELLQVADDTNNETVFTLSPTSSIDENEADQSHIYAYYEMAYAPTIFYNLATDSNVDISVYNLSGQLEIQTKGQSPEGNFFVNKELSSGSYVVVFSNNDIQERLQFIVTQ